jgi:hypothetical protein
MAEQPGDTEQTPAPPHPTGSDPPAPASRAEASSTTSGGGRSGRARTVVVIVLSVVFPLLFALSFVGAFRDPKPHQLPFGVTGSSKLTTQVEKHVSLNRIHYSSEGAVRNAIDHRKIYGALIVQPKTSKLLTAPAAGKSIASLLEVQFALAARHIALNEIHPKEKKAKDKVNEAKQMVAAAQEAAAAGTLSPLSVQQAQQSLQSSATEAQNRLSKAKNAPPPVTAEEVHPLPQDDPNGAVALLTAIGLVFGGYITATILFSATGVAAKRWRATFLVGWAIALGLLVDVLVGPILGGVSGEHFLVLWPILAGIALAVALATAGLQSILGPLGTLIVVLVFVVLGVPASGESLAPSFLPGFWRAVGPYLPPYNAHTLIQNTLYFDGNGITHPLIVLGAFAVLGALLMVVSWTRAARAKSSGEHAGSGAGSASAAAGGGPSNRSRVIVTFVLVIALPLCYIFSFDGANRDPKPHQLPFGVTGSSKLTTQVEKHISLNQTHYSSEKAARNAIDKRKIYGALIVKQKTSKLLTVPAASLGIAGLLEGDFLHAAKHIASNKISVEKKNLNAEKKKASAARQEAAATGAVNPQSVAGAQQDVAQARHRLSKAENAPPPVKAEQVHRLPDKDPIGVVSLLTALAVVIGGYVAATVAMKATGVAAKQWRIAGLLGWAVLTGLLVDVLVGPILGGVSGEHFLVLWPVLAGIAFAMALATAGLQTILGSLGTLVVMVTVIMIGIPASGESLAPSFLPGFWRAVGPYLPPYNAHTLIQNTLYFDGNGITHPLIVLSTYAVLGALVIVVGWTRAARSPIDGETEASAATGAAAAG